MANNYTNVGSRASQSEYSKYITNEPSPQIILSALFAATNLIVGIVLVPWHATPDTNNEVSCAGYDNKNCSLHTNGAGVDETINPIPVGPATATVTTGSPSPQNCIIHLVSQSSRNFTKPIICFILGLISLVVSYRLIQRQAKYNKEFLEELHGQLITNCNPSGNNNCTIEELLGCMETAANLLVEKKSHTPTKVTTDENDRSGHSSENTNENNSATSKRLVDLPDYGTNSDRETSSPKTTGLSSRQYSSASSDIVDNHHHKLSKAGSPIAIPWNKAAGSDLSSTLNLLVIHNFSGQQDAIIIPNDELLNRMKPEQLSQVITSIINVFDAKKLTHTLEFVNNILNRCYRKLKSSGCDIKTGYFRGPDHAKMRYYMADIINGQVDHDSVQVNSASRGRSEQSRPYGAFSPGNNESVTVG